VDTFGCAEKSKSEPSITSFDLVIFDCDGVLVDSEIIAANTLSRLLAREGVETTVGGVLEAFLGKTFASVEHEFRARTGTPLPADFGPLYRSELAAAFQRELKPIAGIREVLLMLSAAGRPICLASSSSQERIETSLQITGLSQFFSGRVFDSSMVQRGKPAPDLFLHVARTLNADPSRTLVIEDSPAGVAAGKAAGMTVWGFVGGEHHAHFAGEAALRLAGTDRILRTMVGFATD
jgi:HAD superfamily hydrolase (TIGR01509 family)